MNLENMLSEKSQTPKDKYCLILFVRNVQWRQILQDGKQINGCQGLGRRDTGVAAAWLLMGMRVLFGEMERF